MMGKLLSNKILLCVVFLFPLLFLPQTVSASNVIMGTVYDKLRNPLNSVDVELLDEYYRMRQRVRTDSVGRYQFSNLNNGNYTVRALPFQYDLEDQSQPVEVFAINASPGDQGSSFAILDFYLVPKKGGMKEAELGVIFAQEIPKDAEKAYKKALNDLVEKRADAGIGGLKEAVKIFPDYYLALYRLGYELFVAKKYGESVHYFIKAAEINPKSATSFYYIGYALFNLGKDYDKAAITALNHAYTLAPASVQVLWLLGKIERDTGKFNEAEKHLLQAKKVSKTKVPEIHYELYNLYSKDLKKYKEAADELELYLKASKFSELDEKKIKKSIIDLREKAKTQFS